MSNNQPLSKDTKMAMTSQFLGFMLDAYDMAMVIVMAPILGKVFISPKGSVLWQLHRGCARILDHHGRPAGWIGVLWGVR